MSLNIPFMQEVVVALRSGEYRQTRGMFIQPNGIDDDGGLRVGGVCVVGLMYHLAARGDWTPVMAVGYGVLASTVKSRTGLNEADLNLLIQMNDKLGYTFGMFASVLEDCIEEQRKKDQKGIPDSIRAIFEPKPELEIA